MTQQDLVEKFRRGERITRSDAEYSMFDAEDLEKAKRCGYQHDWRCIVCWDSEYDIDECRSCGKQSIHRCTFDDDFA